MLRYYSKNLTLFFITFCVFLFSSCSFSESVPLRLSPTYSLVLKQNTLLKSRLDKASHTSRFALNEKAKKEIGDIAKDEMYISLEACIAFDTAAARDVSFSLEYANGEKKSALAFADDLKHSSAASVRLSLCSPVALLADELIVKGGEVKEFSVKVAHIGWQKDEESPLFAFGVNGGVADFSFARADFSKEEVQAIFPKAAKPYIALSMSDCNDFGDIAEQKRVRLSYGDTAISIRRAPNLNETKLYPQNFSAVYSELELRENAAMVRSVLLKSDAKLKDSEPITADPGVIIRWKKENWRREEYELFRWEQFPDVLLLDVKDYATLNQFFTRLAFFAEKRGYRGRLMSDEFIAKEHGYNAHDYSAQTLASFFDTAQKTAFALNSYELHLKTILLENGVIEESADGVKAVRGSLLAISQESPVYLRDRLLAHEGWHGIFFCDEEFRALCFTVYNTMDRKSRLFMREYWSLWASLNYDPADEVLMHNETMAYLLQQSLSEVPQYFIHLTSFKTVQKYLKPLADYVVETEGRGFYAAADRLRRFVYGKYGLSAGRISLISY